MSWRQVCSLLVRGFCGAFPRVVIWQNVKYCNTNLEQCVLQHWFIQWAFLGVHPKTFQIISKFPFEQSGSFPDNVYRHFPGNLNIWWVFQHFFKLWRGVCKGREAGLAESAGHSKSESESAATQGELGEGKTHSRSGEAHVWRAHMSRAKVHSWSAELKFEEDTWPELHSWALTDKSDRESWECRTRY